ncbi:helix-turn-helix transcriptional regulator [Adlercreutzia sp. R7]|uniref:Helix-turn-helix transcriptional regulator n=1 Tax=Adlercreutzia wanghongyangiae TaxID=3111451 RepID=A0ABU6IIT1_9ACTN|nr:helix-turn-helix transcriptional regulator [Adlercreutzia sp. R7]
MSERQAPSQGNLVLVTIALALLMADAAAALLSSGASIIGCLIAFDRMQGFSPLIIGVGIGLALAAIAFARVPPRTLNVTLIRPQVAAGLVAIALVFGAIGLYAPNGGFAPCFAIAGVIFGLGGIGLIAAWGSLLGDVTPIQTLGVVSWAGALAALGSLACLSFANVMVMLAMNALTPVLGGALILRLGLAKPSAEDIAAHTEASPDPCAPPFWPLLAGAGICGIVLGFICGTPQPTNDFVHAETITRGVFLGFIGCTSALGLTALANPPHARLRTVLLGLCPLMAALPSIPCFIAISPEGAAGTFFGILTGAGFGFFAALIGWYLAAFAPFPQVPGQNAPGQRWAATIAVVAATFGVSMLASPWLGDTVKTALSLAVFVAYLVTLATVAFLRNPLAASDATQAQPLTTDPSAIPASAPAAAESEAVPAGTDPLDARCAELAEQGGLSPREREVLALLARGRTATYIAGELYVSKETVKVHVRHIYEKLSVHSRTELLDLLQR